MPSANSVWVWLEMNKVASKSLNMPGGRPLPKNFAWATSSLWQRVSKFHRGQYHADAQLVASGLGFPVGHASGPAIQGWSSQCFLLSGTVVCTLDRNGALHEFMQLINYCFEEGIIKHKLGNEFLSPCELAGLARLQIQRIADKQKHPRIQTHTLLPCPSPWNLWQDPVAKWKSVKLRAKGIQCDWSMTEFWEYMTRIW